MGEKSNSQSAPCWTEVQVHIQLNDKCEEYLPGMMLVSAEFEKGIIRTLTVKDIYGFVSSCLISADITKHTNSVL
jgi:hypothetical protein